MFRRFLIATVVVFAFASSAIAVPPAVAKTNKAVLTHKVIVAVKKNVAPAAEKKLAILVLISQNGGAPAGAVATPSKPLTVLLENSGLYRVRAEAKSTQRKHSVQTSSTACACSIHAGGIRLSPRTCPRCPFTSLGHVVAARVSRERDRGVRPAHGVDGPVRMPRHRWSRLAVKPVAQEFRHVSCLETSEARAMKSSVLADLPS